MLADDIYLIKLVSFLFFYFQHLTTLGLRAPVDDDIRSNCGPRVPESNTQVFDFKARAVNGLFSGLFERNFTILGYVINPQHNHAWLGLWKLPILWFNGNVYQCKIYCSRCGLREMGSPRVRGRDCWCQCEVTVFVICSSHSDLMINNPMIAKTLVSTSIRHRSDTFASDRCLIDVDPMVFAIWAASTD